MEADKVKQEYQTFQNYIVVTSKEKFLSVNKDVDPLESFLDSYNHGQNM